MLNNVTLSSILIDDIYLKGDKDIDFLIDEEFGYIYTGGLKEIEMYIDTRVFKDKYSEKAHKYIYEIFDSPYSILLNKLTIPIYTMPIFWLIWTKSMLEWDYIPSDFYDIAIRVLEWFDLERYHQAYSLPDEEYIAIKYDLPKVINELKNYPIDQLAPPIGDKLK